MIEEWAAALEATELAAALRNSVWSYPLVNAAHILGVGLLVGSIVPLDLRLLGLAFRAACAAVGRPDSQRRQRSCPGNIFGMLLFITRATEYIASNLFIAKMLVVAIGTANVLTLRILPSAQASEIASLHAKSPVSLRLAAGISLGTWLTALTLGRLIGYF